jgi:carbonic anhydrase
MAYLPWRVTGAIHRAIARGPDVRRRGNERVMRSRCGGMSLIAYLVAAGIAVGCGGDPSPSPQVAPAAPPPVASTAIAPPAASDAVPASATAQTDAGPAHAGPPHWGYDAPEGWGDLSADWATCKTGRNQTPIDLSTKTARAQALKPLAFHYAALPLQIFNNGHTVQVKNTASSTLVAGGQTWDLLQFHFHAPSEHTIDGKAYDAELHLVHKSEAGSDLAVVGVFLKTGKASAPLAAVFDHAPKDVSTEPRAIANTSVDLTPLLPAKGAYYTYPGSLSVPPCSENVTWYVLAQPVEVSPEQLQKLVDALGAKTARPVQPLNGRTVQAFRP